MGTATVVTSDCSGLFGRPTTHITYPSAVEHVSDGSIKTLKVYLVGRYSNRVELTGLEPATSWLQTRRSTN
jgi:hypothetical protein